MARFRLWILLLGVACAWAWQLPECVALLSIPDDGIATRSESDDRHPQQAQAVAAIIDLGGEVTFRDDSPDQPVIAVDLDHPCHPVAPNSFLPRLTPNDLAHLSCFPHLQRLHLSGYWITGAHLEKLSRLTELEYLDLFWASINDDDLNYLQNLTKLRELHLKHCCYITDKGMKHLRQLVNMEILNLDLTKVSGSGLEELTPLVKLKDLSLEGCEINDQGVQQLEKFKQLEGITLSVNALTDKCLDSLKKIPKLRAVNLSSTEVSDEGIAAFRKARPKTSIYK